MITIKNLCIVLNEQKILNDVSCTIPRGRITCIIGKSGAGKTTLLRSLAGIVKPRSGTITIDTMELARCNARTRAQKIGFVFQDFNLFAHMTVLQNCIDPLLIQGLTRNDATNRALCILTQLGMNEKLDFFPKQLSGGQQQRTAIARALCLQPSILLLDEPTASLDPENSAILAEILRTLVSRGLTVVLSTQDMQFARTINDRTIFMQNGEIVEECDQAAECTDCLKIKKYINAENR